MNAGSHPAGGAAPAPGAQEDAGWLEPLLRRLYAASPAERYGMAWLEFAVILGKIGAKYLPPGAGEEDAAKFFARLRLDELVLARACAAGNERAWEEFLTRFREKLFDAGRAITRDDAGGRELADSLYADLWGATTGEGGERKSKLDSYTGRGSLEGWLRTVLAQEYVNRYRTRKRLVSLDEQSEAGVQFAAAPQSDPVAADARLAAATDEALAALAAEDRYILASYFLDQRTLAEVARTLGVHESTISRKIEKLVTSLRKQITEGMVRRGMSRRQAEEALAADVRDIAVNIRGHLLQEQPGAAFPSKAEK